MSFVCELLAGIIDDNGQVIKEVELKEITGRLRKEIAEKQNRKDANRAIDLIVRHTVSRLGSITPVPDTLLDKMLAGDRDFLLIKLRECSTGKDSIASVTCSSCSKDIKFNLDLDMLTRYPLGPNRIDKNFGYVMELVDKDFDIKGTFRYVTISDSRKLFNIMQKNPIEALYLMFAATCISWKDSVVPVGPKFFEDMPTKQFDRLNEMFSNNLPGIEMSHSVICPDCDEKTPFEVSPVDFFFPTGGRRANT